MRPAAEQENYFSRVRRVARHRVTLRNYKPQQSKKNEKENEREKGNKERSNKIHACDKKRNVISGVEYADEKSRKKDDTSPRVIREICFRDTCYFLFLFLSLSLSLLNRYS